MALFCMFVYCGIMLSEQLGLIFKKHEVKTTLFHIMFRNHNSCVKDGEFYYGEILLKNLDLKDLTNSDPDYVEKYNSKREDSLYVKPNEDGTSYDPVNNQLTLIHDGKEYVTK